MTAPFAASVIDDAPPVRVELVSTCFASAGEIATDALHRYFWSDQPQLVDDGTVEARLLLRAAARQPRRADEPEQQLIAKWSVALRLWPYIYQSLLSQRKKTDYILDLKSVKQSLINATSQTCPVLQRLHCRVMPPALHTVVQSWTPTDWVAFIRREAAYTEEDAAIRRLVKPIGRQEVFSLF